MPTGAFPQAGAHARPPKAPERPSRGMGSFMARAGSLEQRDRALEQRDRAFKQRDRTFKQRDRTFEQRDRTLEQRDRTFEQRDRAFKQRDRAFKQRDRAFKQRDRALEQRDRSVRATRSAGCVLSSAVRANQTAVPGVPSYVTPPRLHQPVGSRSTLHEISAHGTKRLPYDPASSPECHVDGLTTRSYNQRQAQADNGLPRAEPSSRWISSTGSHETLTSQYRSPG